jgi:hypothetical protein
VAPPLPQAALLLLDNDQDETKKETKKGNGVSIGGTDWMVVDDDFLIFALTFTLTLTLTLTYTLLSFK